MTKESAGPLALPSPDKRQPYIDVSALEAGIIHLPLQFFVAGVPPSEISVCPSLAFFLRHSESKAQIIFDLGLRRDTESYPPAVHSLISKWMPVSVPQSVAESLSKGGVDPAEVQTIILSHLHFDHIGDSTPFTKASFIVGAACRDALTSGYPSNRESYILASSIPHDRAHYLEAGYFNTSIGPFPHARDYFGDGSLYIIDAAGHTAGHINILARTSPDGSWIYLGGDSAHDTRLISGEKEVAFKVDPNGGIICAHDDKDQAVEHIRRVGELAKLPKVQILCSHDREWYERNKGGPAFLPGTIPPV